MDQKPKIDEKTRKKIIEALKQLEGIKRQLLEIVKE